MSLKKEILNRLNRDLENARQLYNTLMTSGHAIALSTSIAVESGKVEYISLLINIIENMEEDED